MNDHDVDASDGQVAETDHSISGVEHRERSRPSPSPVDTVRIQAAVREILLAIGEDPEREGLLRTPERVAATYVELFAGLQEDPRRHLR